MQLIFLDLRYLLTPGLWERNETVGLLLGFESGQYGRYSAGKVGVGIFWARSMPKVFDELLNEVVFMRYPKWVDMEIVNYVMSPSSDVILDNDFVINFHGKILWTDKFFGEAGFGFKRYSFLTGPEKDVFQMQTFYGTVGLGLNF